MREQEWEKEGVEKEGLEGSSKGEGQQFIVFSMKLKAEW